MGSDKRKTFGRRQRRLTKRFFVSYEPDPVGVALGTGYNQFVHKSGVSGLALSRPGRLDILAVVAARPGKGQFRDFIAAAKTAFNTVAVWLDWNPVTGAALQRYGFARVDIEGEAGQRVHGWEWRRGGTLPAKPAPAGLPADGIVLRLFDDLIDDTTDTDTNQRAHT